MFHLFEMSCRIAILNLTLIVHRAQKGIGYTMGQAILHGGTQ